MTDTNKYRIWFSNKNFCNNDYQDFKTRGDIVKWLKKYGILGVARITFNNKGSSPGRTGWVDVKTLLGLWKDVDVERTKSVQPSP